jgi:hypothetical protein
VGLWFFASKSPLIAFSVPAGASDKSVISSRHFPVTVSLLARIIHEGTESGSLGGVCALRMVVAA